MKVNHTVGVGRYEFHASIGQLVASCRFFVLAQATDVTN